MTGASLEDDSNGMIAQHTSCV